MVELIKVKRTDKDYQEIRDRHYVPNHGCIGRQLHYNILEDGKTIGIISGASAIWASEYRDKYFKITKDNRKERINKIIDNVVFRLEDNVKNLGTQILSQWRKQVKEDWEKRYNDNVIGYETFIFGDGRFGSMYKADNWDYAGMTKGNTKLHKHGAYNGTERVTTNQKMIFCKLLKNKYRKYL
jgi:hypothetical protein